MTEHLQRFGDYTNDKDTFSWGSVAYNADTYLRIWVTPNGQEYQYGGP